MISELPARRALGAFALASFMAACAPASTPPSGPSPDPRAPVYEPVSPALPPIPRTEGPLMIRVVHPTPSTPRPAVDSTFIYGSVGTGGAGLTINGAVVPVATNGAFLAYLPVPADGRYELLASRGAERQITAVEYRTPASAPRTPATPPAGAIPEGVLAAPRAATVSGGADTLSTGSGVAIGRPSPAGTYRWFLPRGARVSVVERRGDQYRVNLGGGTDAWVATEEITLQGPAPASSVAAPVASLAINPRAGWVDLVFGAGGAPFLAEPGGDALRITLYGRSAPTRGPAAEDPLLAGITWSGATGNAQAAVRLTRPLWGYKAFYTPAGDLVVRLRRPPEIDPGEPLRGRRIVIDPGHPPAGATGPTGLTEAEANLAISTRLAAMLRERGAEVILTRTANEAVALAARPELAVRADADLLVSVHNNAFGEGVNPFRGHGTSTYYFHPFSEGLARALNDEIVGVTRIRDLGAREGNLALVRPTWMPSALTESLFMMIPEQEAALRNPQFLDRLAAAHLRGIETFLRERSRPATP